jgi:hypothetical protein
VTFAYRGNGTVADLVDPETNQAVDEPIEVVVPDRDYAIELGVESLIDGDWGSATLRAFHDVRVLRCPLTSRVGDSASRAESQ